MITSHVLAAWVMVLAGFFGNSARAAEGQSSVRGLLYISYSGDLSVDVMYAKAVEVLLLKGSEDLEKEINTLKGQRLPQIQAQDAAMSKAIGEARKASRTEKERKQKQEALKREGEKLEKLRSEYNKDVDALVAKYVIQRTKTNDEGKFRFEGLAPGRYLLHARFEVRGADSNYFWLYPVEPKQGQEIEVHLNKAAAISLY